MEIVPLGDNALLIRLPCDLEKAPEQTLETVLDASRRLQTAKIPGVVELVPAYTTIALFYDPVRVVDGGAPIDDIVGWLGAKIESTLRGSSKRKARKSSSRLVEIPVCYDKEFGFDLEEVAQRAKLSVGETIQMHTAADVSGALRRFHTGVCLSRRSRWKTGDAAPPLAAHWSSGWIGCDRREANGCLSDSIARRLECNRSYTLTDV